MESNTVKEDKQKQRTWIEVQNMLEDEANQKIRCSKYSKTLFAIIV